MTEETTVAARPKYRVVVNTAWCKGCGICVALCPKGMLKADGLDQKVKATDESLCINCKICEVHCPDFAIEVIRSEEE